MRSGANQKWEMLRLRVNRSTAGRIQEGSPARGSQGLRRAIGASCASRHNGTYFFSTFTVQAVSSPATLQTASPSALVHSVTQALDRLGLWVRGGFKPEPSDALPALPNGQSANTLLMVGNAGPALWRAFSASPEAADGQAHPLNRWTRQHVDAIANAAGGVALYPFDAAPVWPFQRWAPRAEPVRPSPLGLLIHPQYGLWHAYRAAILLATDENFPAHAPSVAPCSTCADRPCLTSCPVGAFSSSGYDVPACARHLDSPEGQDCLEGGCLARRACPVGAGYAQAPAQNAFHMRAFYMAVSGPVA